VTALVSAALPSVVSISVELPGGRGEGSGFLISSDGAIVTNAHVVADATAVSVTMHDGSRHKATVVGVDRTDDLAVIDIDGTGLAALTLGDSTGLAVGTPVVAIGNALGLTGGPTATSGIVSGVDRSIDTNNGEHLSHLLQTDAAINPGNSGGPLLTLDGRVVGVNSAGATDAQNVGFAIGISGARTIIDQLEQGKTVSRPFLGVSTIVIDPGVARSQGLAVEHGLLVTDVVAGSGAGTAGLRAGDVIVSAAGAAIDDETALRDAISAAGAGSELGLVVNRDGKEIALTATLSSQPA
jgi:S1-C subfamily serine protease